MKIKRLYPLISSSLDGSQVTTRKDGSYSVKGKAFTDHYDCFGRYNGRSYPQVVTSGSGNVFISRSLSWTHYENQTVVSTG